MRFSIKYFRAGNNLNAHMSGLQINEVFSHIPPEQFQHFTEEHSWCAPAQLFLLHRLKGETGFASQAERAALFFSNTHWLTWQLSLLDRPSNNPHQPKNEMIFEPMHTVDYFGSQGIKIP